MLKIKLDIAKALFDLFNSREDTYAIRSFFEGRKMYAPARGLDGKDLPFTVQVCDDHLNGKVSIGCYPLDKEDNIKWVALDFDGKKGNALEDAITVKQSLERELGLITWLEKSQSGNGIHLWVFFEQKLPARAVRAVIGKLVPEFDTPPEHRTTSFDRMFPNQDSAFGSYGNLCALPLNGPELVKKSKTAFIKDSGESYTTQSLTLLDILKKRNAVEAIVLKAKNIPSKPVRKQLRVLTSVPGGMKLLCPTGCAWLRKCEKNSKVLSEPEWYAALGQFARVDDGEVLAHRFSKDYPGYSYEETQKKFEHAKAAPAMTCETVWERFGFCGKDCHPLGVNQPWQLAKVPLAQLDNENKGRVHDAKELAEVAGKLVDEAVSGKRLGFSWGYDLLDDFTELRPRNLIVVAARQGMGKTAAMIDASFRGAERGIPQYIFSIEMGYEELSLRYVSRLTELDHSRIQMGKLRTDEFLAVRKALEHFKTLPLFIDDSTRDQDKMLDNAGELIYKNGPGIVWIDYLQLIRKKGGESKKEAVDRVVDAYKSMAKFLDVPVVTLAQLNRTEETTEASDDLDSWLKDSGDIEQTADVIHYIRGKRGPGIIDRRWRLHKERHRPSGVNLRFEFVQHCFKFQCKGYWDQIETKEFVQPEIEEALNVFG
jgi:replicative DNA helicase